MSIATDIFAAGFAEMEAVFGAQPITATAFPLVTNKTCILSNVDASRVRQDSGSQPQYTAVAELLRTDATALGLYPLETTQGRPVCTVAGRTYKRLDIEDDPHDNYVRLHLIPFRPPA